jgi:Tfp pilus assembly protein PilF
MGYTLYEASLEEQDAARKQEILDEAVFYLDRSLSIHPSYRDALNVYAGVYEKLGDPTKANLMRQRASLLNTP